MTIRVEPPDSGSFDVDSIVRSLQTRFAGVEVTSGNSFQSARENALKAMEELAREGRPVKRPDLVLASISHRQAFFVPGKDVRVSCGNQVFCGHLWRKDIALWSKGTVTRGFIETLSGYLESLGVGEVNVYE